MKCIVVKGAGRMKVVPWSLKLLLKGIKRFFFCFCFLPILDPFLHQKKALIGKMMGVEKQGGTKP